MKIYIITSIILIQALFINDYPMSQKFTQEKIFYNVETTHPTDQLRVEFVSDTIFTLGGGQAHIPYGGTSGEWGKSYTMFTKQSGVPKHIKIVYYALYEDVFYDFDVQLPVEHIKEMMDRAYAIRESKSNKSAMKEFIRLSEHSNFEEQFNLFNTSYAKVSDFVLGFSPKGKVTLWLRYNRIQKLIGEFKATPIVNDEQVAETFYSKMAIDRQKAREIFYLNKEVPDLWSDYLYSSKWLVKPVVANDHQTVIELNIKYFNQESEALLRPWVLKEEIKQRGIPKMISISWESTKGEEYYAYIYYDWKTSFSAFKQNKKEEFKTFKIHIEDDNQTIKTHLGSQELINENISIFKSDDK